MVPYASLLDESVHLVKRFFGFLVAKPLSPREQSEVNKLLRAPAAELFWAQQPQDQRHAVDVMRATLNLRPGDRLAARAALLHDVGKNHARVGALGRSLATLGDVAGLPLRGRWATYRRHSELGAEDLAAIGEDRFVVEFTRLHPAPAPEGMSIERWAAVASADQSVS